MSGGGGGVRKGGRTKGEWEDVIGKTRKEGGKNGWLLEKIIGALRGSGGILPQGKL